ncbi:type II toxin-antitoxin system RelE/ParE family toxin [Massilia antarctica]|uniref:Type II toxin-antitoxin system RelE/ParE family toxin n=1 Tax=Massilia antarctica TaxID=2765360 RepID=A0AA49A9L4_9BURK|nr:type II toxin-antitoxin system RelE/ParE family toxin [Massilia antarctica]QPI51768.1 type II toxin-antitoxin system RelE/ParE family toxin [Massilia antarctica]
MKTLRLSKSAAKFWGSLDAKQYRQVGKAITTLLENSRPQDSQCLKVSRHAERRVDAGEYRIIYVDSDEEIEVLVIGKRNDDEVYKRLRQK